MKKTSKKPPPKVRQGRHDVSLAGANMPGIQSFRNIGHLDDELCQRYMPEVAPARETSCLPI